MSVNPSAACHSFFRQYDRAFQHVVDAAARRGTPLPAENRHRAAGDLVARCWPALAADYRALRALRMRFKYDGAAPTEADLDRMRRFAAAVAATVR